MKLMPTLIHQACMATGRQNRNEGNSIWLHASLLHLGKKYESILTIPMHPIPCNHGILGDYIFLRHSVKYLACTNNIPTLSIHVY